MKLMKLALIDGMPLNQKQNVSIWNDSSTPYSWDSNQLGVSEFMQHSTNMLDIVFTENPKAEVIVFPFYPKYDSVFKNYQLIAENIENAVSQKCNIICVCLEVVGAKYLSSQMIKAYQYAYANKVVICVSAGNSKFLNNPLIHKKYTIPVIGYVQNKLPNNTYRINYSNFDSIKTLKSISIQTKHTINCSKATAQFAAKLSKDPFCFQIMKSPNRVVELIYT